MNKIIKNLHVVVIAGGSGTRFWPLSRRTRPKQLIDLTGHGTLLHATFERVAAVAESSHNWMVVGEHHAQGCLEAAPMCPPDQMLVEPIARNTAPAIALAAAHLVHHSPDSIMAVLPADHHVPNDVAFCDALSRAATLAREDVIVTLGIQPTHPETGFGYIERGAADTRVPGAYAVKRFCEKPNAERARQFLAQGGFDWNAGIFVMRPQVLLAEVARQLPELHQEIQKIAAAIGTADYATVLKAAYTAMKGISIDFGVMENAQHIAVIPVECGWSDVGSWSALGSVVQADAAGNVLAGNAVALETKNSIIYATPGHVVGVVGMEGVVVVHTPDATLVLPAERAQDVRQIIEELGTRKWDQFL